MSAYHIRAVQSLDFAEVAAIADVNLERAREVPGRFHIPAAYGSLEEMRDSSPDSIHVLTPPALHCDIAVQALAMGCHVMVEKPMANTVEECDRMGGLLRGSVSLTRYRVASIRGIGTFDCSAARDLLGWVPRIGVKRGMELMCSPPFPASHVLVLAR